MCCLRFRDNSVLTICCAAPIEITDIDENNYLENKTNQEITIKRENQISEYRSVQNNHRNSQKNRKHLPRIQQGSPSELSGSKESSKSKRSAGSAKRNAHRIPTESTKPANVYFIYCQPNISKYETITMGDTNPNENAMNSENAQPTPATPPTTIAFDYIQMLAVQYPLPGQPGAPAEGLYAKGMIKMWSLYLIKTAPLDNVLPVVSVQSLWYKQAGTRMCREQG